MRIRMRQMGIFGFWLLLFATTHLAFGQQTKQQQLEAQKQQLREEIKQINNLLFSSRKKKTSVLSDVEELSFKIDRMEQLVRLTNQQINGLTQQIQVNQKTIEKLRKELKTIKEDYAAMIVKSYDSKSQQNRLMFLLSSESFLQGYKRFQYMKQYASYRRKQGVLIQEKTQTLQELNLELATQKEKKQELVLENRNDQKTIEKERKQQEELVLSLKRKEKTYAAQIKKKQQQSDAIDREIDRLIREAIAASNKKKGTKKATFALTPEDKKLAANFVANQGKLPWPVLKGVVIQSFGTQRHPVVKTTTIKSNGVVIATPPNSKARAVFNGQVLSVLQFKGSNPTVLIQHGNYITAYKNLAKVFVKKGDRVVAKQDIGEVFTNTSTDKTQLQFSVFKNTTPQDPSRWIYKM